MSPEDENPDCPVGRLALACGDEKRRDRCRGPARGHLPGLGVLLPAWGATRLRRAEQGALWSVDRSIRQSRRQRWPVPHRSAAPVGIGVGTVLGSLTAPWSSSVV